VCSTQKLLNPAQMLPGGNNKFANPASVVTSSSNRIINPAGSSLLTEKSAPAAPGALTVGQQQVSGQTTRGTTLLGG
jgi:hypothetical protein